MGQALSFVLRRPASHRTIVRKVVRYGGRYLQVANVGEPADLDDGLRDLRTEAYDDTAS